MPLVVTKLELTWRKAMPSGEHECGEENVECDDGHAVAECVPQSMPASRLPAPVVTSHTAVMSDFSAGGD